MDCRADGTLTRLFTPAAMAGDYTAYVSELALDRLAELLRGASAPFAVQEMDALDAFGDAGPYSKPKVGRLYVGRRIRVARGPIVEQGRVVAAITLLSPYPDPSLSRLVPGTLVIELRIRK